MKEVATYKDILTFWFEENGSEQWYQKDDEFDQKTREKFEKVYWSVARGETAHWRDAPEGRLAEIIVLDQFARNMFRGTAQAFAADALALFLAQEALRVGADVAIEESRRTFFYMPYMHSESQAIHEEALKIFENLPSYDYELKHKAIIDQFGRYPNRNAALGRTSTPEEIDFMKKNTGF